MEIYLAEIANIAINEWSKVIRKERKYASIRPLVMIAADIFIWPANGFWQNSFYRLDSGEDADFRFIAIYTGGLGGV